MFANPLEVFQVGHILHLIGCFPASHSPSSTREGNASLKKKGVPGSTKGSTSSPTQGSSNHGATEPPYKVRISAVASLGLNQNGGVVVVGGGGKRIFSTTSTSLSCIICPRMRMMVVVGSTTGDLLGFQSRDVLPSFNSHASSCIESASSRMNLVFFIRHYHRGPIYDIALEQKSFRIATGGHDAVARLTSWNALATWYRATYSSSWSRSSSSRRRTKEGASFDCADPLHSHHPHHPHHRRSGSNDGEGGGELSVMEKGVSAGWFTTSAALPPGTFQFSCSDPSSFSELEMPKFGQEDSFAKTTTKVEEINEHRKKGEVEEEEHTPFLPFFSQFAKISSSRVILLGGHSLPVIKVQFTVDACYLYSLSVEGHLREHALHGVEIEEVQVEGNPEEEEVEGGKQKRRRKMDGEELASPAVSGALSEHCSRASAGASFSLRSSPPSSCSLPFSLSLFPSFTQSQTSTSAVLSRDFFSQPFFLPKNQNHNHNNNSSTNTLHTCDSSSFSTRWLAHTFVLSPDETFAVIAGEGVVWIDLCRCNHHHNAKNNEDGGGGTRRSGGGLAGLCLTSSVGKRGISNFSSSCCCCSSTSFPSSIYKGNIWIPRVEEGRLGKRRRGAAADQRKEEEEKDVGKDRVEEEGINMKKVEDKRENILREEEAIAGEKWEVRQQKFVMAAQVGWWMCIEGEHQKGEKESECGERKNTTTTRKRVRQEEEENEENDGETKSDKLLHHHGLPSSSCIYSSLCITSLRWIATGGATATAAASSSPSSSPPSSSFSSSVAVPDRTNSSSSCASFTVGSCLTYHLVGTVEEKQEIFFPFPDHPDVPSSTSSSSSRNDDVFLPGDRGNHLLPSSSPPSSFSSKSNLSHHYNTPIILRGGEGGVEVVGKLGKCRERRRKIVGELIWVEQEGSAIPVRTLGRDIPPPVLFCPQYQDDDHSNNDRLFSSSLSSSLCGTSAMTRSGDSSHWMYVLHDHKATAILGREGQTYPTLPVSASSTLSSSSSSPSWNTSNGVSSLTRVLRRRGPLCTTGEVLAHLQSQKLALHEMCNELFKKLKKEIMLASTTTTTSATAAAGGGRGAAATTTTTTARTSSAGKEKKKSKRRENAVFAETH